MNGFFISSTFEEKQKPMKKLFLVLVVLVVTLSCKKENYTPVVYTMETQSYFDAEHITIDKTKFDGSNADFSVEAWYKLNNEWLLIPITSNAGGANVSIVNGNVQIVLNMAPSENALPVKIRLSK